jgi:hypothetical protein
MESKMKRYYVKYSVPQFAFALGEGLSLEDAMNRGGHEPVTDSVIIEIEKDFVEAWEVNVAVAKTITKFRDGVNIFQYNDEDIIPANIEPMWITIDFIGLL